MTNRFTLVTTGSEGVQVIPVFEMSFRIDPHHISQLSHPLDRRILSGATTGDNHEQRKPRPIHSESGRQ